MDSCVYYVDFAVNDKQCGVQPATLYVDDGKVKLGPYCSTHAIEIKRRAKVHFPDRDVKVVEA